MLIAKYTPPAHVGTNFGDELNSYLWPQLLPPEGATLLSKGVLLGIGTILNRGVQSEYPPDTAWIVCGAGAGYHPPPALSDKWTFYAVRGPRTARALGLVPEMAVTDPGILVANFHRRQIPKYPIGLMPRFDTAHTNPGLEAYCKSAGLRIIDPRWPVEHVIEDISRCGHVITEAFHGAVVADALRVPWVPIRFQRGHDEKWHDWFEAMELGAYAPVDIARGSGIPREAMRNPLLSRDAIHHTRLEEMRTRVGLLADDIKERRGPFA